MKKAKVKYGKIPSRLNTLLKRLVIPMGREDKKPHTEFVRRMRALSARIGANVIWNSSKNGTYRRANHGAL